MKRNILVIGGNGYLGSHIVDFHLTLGDRVFVTSRSKSQKKNVISLDIRRQIKNKLSSEKLSYIYILAGMNGVKDSFINYNNYIKTNEIGLINILEYIRVNDRNAHIVYISSRLVYSGSEKEIAECSPMDPKSVYAVNKIASEYFLKCYSNAFGLKHTIFRLCVPFGNILNTKYSYGTVGSMINSASKGMNITIFGDGLQRRTFTYIGDFMKQILLALNCRESTNGIFNIGGCTMSIKELAELIASKFNVKVINTEWPEYDLKIETGSTVFCSEKIEKLIGPYSYKTVNQAFFNL